MKRRIILQPLLSLWPAPANRLASLYYLEASAVNFIGASI